MFRLKSLSFYSKLSILAFYCFCVSIFLGMNEILTFLGIVFTLPYGLRCVINRNYIINKYQLLLLVPLLCGAFLNVFFTSNGFGGVLVILGVVFLSVFIVENVSLLLLHVLAILLLFIFVCYYKILVLDVDPNCFYVGMSRNYLGLILVSFNILYSFLYYVVKSRFDILISVLSLILAILFVGRSTIGAICALLLLNLFFNLKGKNRFMICVIVILIIFVVFHYFTFIIDLYKASSFGGFGLDTPRFELWSDFFAHSDMFVYILGVDTFSIPIVAQYEGNLHNGFLNILARTGIGCFFFLYVYFNALVRYLTNGHFYIVCLLFIISFRTFFDTGVFIGNLGFVFYTIVLYPFFSNNKYKIWKFKY